MGDNCVIYIPLPPEFSSLELSIEVCPLHFPYKLALWYMCSANVGPRQVIWKLEEQRCFYLRYSGCCCLLSVIASIARVEMKRVTEDFVGPISGWIWLLVPSPDIHGNSLAVWNLTMLASSSPAGDASSWTLFWRYWKAFRYHTPSAVLQAT